MSDGTVGFPMIRLVIVAASKNPTLAPVALVAWLGVPVPPSCDCVEVRWRQVFSKPSGTLAGHCAQHCPRRPVGLMAAHNFGPHLAIVFP